MSRAVWLIGLAALFWLGLLLVLIDAAGCSTANPC